MKILVAGLFFAGLSASANDEKCFQLNTSYSEKVIIEKYICTNEDVVIPAMIGTKKVTEIA